MQNAGLIGRVARNSYAITEAGRALLRGRASIRSNAGLGAPLGLRCGSKEWSGRATLHRRAPAPALASMRRPLRNNETAVLRGEVGSGKAKRAYAPSIDKIDPTGFYTVDNCRLVMVAINFALNAWGLAVYRKLAEAAVRARDGSGDPPSAAA